MFKLFNKRDPAPLKEDLSGLSDAAIAEIKEKWVAFDRTIQLDDSVSLGQKIDLFAQPLSDFFQQKYPELLLGGSRVFWLTTLTAVIESGTHPKAVVNAAVAELRSKYAGKM